MNLAAALALLLPLAPAPADDAPARYAIVIGFNGEGSARPPLAFSDDDAARFYLQQLPTVEKAWLLTTFDGASARAFPDLAAVARSPTRAELARVLGELAWSVRNAGSRTTELTFFFAGHGDVDPAGEGYIVLADGDMTRGDLYTHVVKGSPATINHLVLDACASFFMVARDGEATSARAPLTPDVLDVLQAGDRDDPSVWARTGVFVSTSDDSQVHETSELGSGVFSFLLRSALSGAADTNADGKVEYAEAAGFIAAASASIPDPRAQLRVHARAPAQRPNSALVDISGGGFEHFLSVAAGGPGHVRILDARGIPYAELNRTAGQPVLVSLVGNAFYVVQVDDKEAILVPRSAGAYALSSLSFTDATTKRRADGDVAFAQLFREPFGNAFLTAYLAESPLPKPFARPAMSVEWAQGAEPPFVLPWRGIAVGTFVASAALAVAAASCAAGNLLSYQALDSRFADSAAVDRDRAFQVEGWRTAATVTSAASLAVGLGAVGLWWVADEAER